MSEERVSYEEALKMAQEHNRQALEAVLIDREAKIARLQQENKMAKALLGDVLDGGYGARYGWGDAHDWLKANCAEYAAKFRDPTDKEMEADV